ncbi:phosphatidylinositol transfer protein csr1 [Coemansia interrupta]|uniref:Phosphatidylinositol transfer protein csr1 n=1 Tax=Coemansia interrupta TaxID=1126814 RepID=A0A9W8HPP2_9FUNG|nr:phosphatidylinositol transfer protein csr1 [Coemansia interrupta]
MVISQASVQNEYATRTASTDGCPGHFTAEEQRKMAKLWSLLLDYLSEVRDKSVKVKGEHLHKIERDWSMLKPDESPKLDEKEDDEAVTRRAWEQFTKGGSSIKRLGGLFSKKQQLTREQLVLDRHVNETTWQYVDRMAGRHVALMPDEFIPSFAHPSRDTRNLWDTFWQTVTIKEHPDFWVYRYMISSGWNVDKALADIKSVIEWRATEALDQINYEGDVGIGYDELRLGMSRLIGKDRLGLPLTYVRIRKIMPRATESHVFKRYLMTDFEMTQNVTRTDIRSTILYDFTGFSMDNTPLAMILFMVELGMKPYAESTSVLIMLVDSWLFNNLWSLVRPFLDANLGARIIFAKTVDEVRKFIDDDQLPVELGGTNTFAADYVLPTEEENRKMFDMEGRRAAEDVWRKRIAEFEVATKEWTQAVATASDAEVLDAGFPCTACRDAAACELGRAELALNKFTRTRNILERRGMVGADGNLKLP